MKTNCLNTLACVAVASLCLSALTASGQEPPASTQPTTADQPSSTVAPAPPLAYGVSQILQLQQAKMGDDTIIAYIKNSGNSYGLNADQIIYLRQQGVSPVVLNAMLSQPPAGVLGGSSPMPGTTPAPAAPVMYQSQPASTTVVGPPVTGIDPSQAAGYPPYYYQSAYYPYYGYPYYYPGYGFYPGVSVSLGWRGGWGGWHGGYGGFHGGGGGFHGGWHH